MQKESQLTLNKKIPQKRGLYPKCKLVQKLDGFNIKDDAR